MNVLDIGPNVCSFPLILSLEESVMEALSKEYINMLEHKVLLETYRRLTEKGIDPMSIRIILSSRQKDN